MTPLLAVKGIYKSYDQQPFICDVSFSLNPGELLCLLGSSGCGKTSLLRLIAGLETPDRGQICFDGCNLSETAPHKRHFGLMFQEFALFPHKDVFENVAYGCRVQKQPAEAVSRRTREMLELVGLERFAHRNISELSGGERQRVALARSLAPRPRLLMLDEPLGSLDRALREHLVSELRHILKAVGVTAIFVTHDQAEAFAVADAVAVMHAGRIEQIAAPQQLYRHPQNAIVARFLGFQNLLSARYLPDGNVQTTIGVFAVNQASRLSLPATSSIVLRPDAVEIAQGLNGSGANQIIGKLARCIFQGPVNRIHIQTALAQPLVFDLPIDAPLPNIGADICLRVRPEGVAALPERMA